MHDTTQPMWPVLVALGSTRRKGRETDDGGLQEVPHEFAIAKTAKRASRPPSHRLYAKLVLRRDSTKEYLPATEGDLAAFKAASERLEALSPPCRGWPSSMATTRAKS